MNHAETQRPVEIATYGQANQEALEDLWLLCLPTSADQPPWWLSYPATVTVVVANATRGAQGGSGLKLVPAMTMALK